MGACNLSVHACLRAYTCLIDKQLMDVRAYAEGAGGCSTSAQSLSGIDQQRGSTPRVACTNFSSPLKKPVLSSNGFQSPETIA